MLRQVTEPLPFASGEQACHRVLNAIDVIGARWTGSILMAAVRGARRFKEYRALIGGISDSQLTVRLKELQARGLIARTVIPSTPVQITYTLTTAGEELIAALVPLSQWGEQHLAGDDDA